MAKRKALGRGLSALLESSEQAPQQRPQKKEVIGNVAGAIMMLRIGQIVANPFQPRVKFNETALKELAQSIKELGIIQPITVRKTAVDKYQLISGERRFRASQIAGLEEIPAYVRTADDESMLEMALVENIQRENLDPIEIAISYKRLMEECSLTQEELSLKVGKNRSTVTNYMRLLKLPGEVQLGLIEKQITMGHARALINAGNEALQIKIFKQIIKDDLSVRKVEELVRSASGKTSKKISKESVLSFEHQKLQADIRLKFGKTSSMKRNSEGKGKIEISFDSDDDLQNIIELLDL